MSSAENTAPVAATPAAAAPASSASDVKKKKDWIPLESDPELMTKYLHALGADPDNNYMFHEIYGTDPDLLSMIPQPCLAVLLLFPISATSEALKASQETDLKTSKAADSLPDSLFYMKQTVGNACGTIGLLHAAFNNKTALTFKENSFFDKFYKICQKKTPEEIGAALEENNDIEVEHQSIAQEGKTDGESAMDTNLHFICFVPSNGGLYELDGRKFTAVNHGATSEETFLADATKVIKEKFIDVESGDVRFNMVALGPA